MQAKTDEAHQRKAAYDKLLACKRLEPISGCSDHLHSHVAAHFVNAELQGGQVQLSEVLTQAVDYGHPQLADEAQRHNRSWRQLELRQVSRSQNPKRVLGLSTGKKESARPS